MNLYTEDELEVLHNSSPAMQRLQIGKKINDVISNQKSEIEVLLVDGYTLAEIITYLKNIAEGLNKHMAKDIHKANQDPFDEEDPVTEEDAIAYADNLFLAIQEHFNDAHSAQIYHYGDTAGEMQDVSGQSTLILAYAETVLALDYYNSLHVVSGIAHSEPDTESITEYASSFTETVIGLKSIDGINLKNPFKTVLKLIDYTDLGGIPFELVDVYAEAGAGIVATAVKGSIERNNRNDKQVYLVVSDDNGEFAFSVSRGLSQLVLSAVFSEVYAFFDTAPGSERSYSNFFKLNI